MGMGLSVFGRVTLTPFDNMGVMTMKMMSSTSITSTMGVTLMSATGGGALNFVSFDFFSAMVFSMKPGEKCRGTPCEVPRNSTRRIPIAHPRPEANRFRPGHAGRYLAAPRCERFRK